MSLRLSRRKQEELAQERREHEVRLLLPYFRLAQRNACHAVAAFNAQVHSRFPILAWPTFRAAWYAERYYLGVLCDACKQETCIDIEKIDWHPEASINSLIPYLHCSRCGPSSPNAILTGLWKRPRTIVLTTQRFRRLPADLPRRTWR